MYIIGNEKKNEIFLVVILNCKLDKLLKIGKKNCNFFRLSNIYFYFSKDFYFCLFFLNI